MKKLKKQHLIILNIIIFIGVSLVFAQDRVREVFAKKGYNPLSGVTIVVDPGHGGKDAGAMRGDINEQDINLSISLKLKTMLEENGATVILTRDGAYDLASENADNRKREDMQKRVEIINGDTSDLFISIHLNSYPNTSVKGAQAFYQRDNYASKYLANIVQGNLQKLTGTKMVEKSGDYYLLNNSKKPGILVECGFISNEEDRGNLIQDSYQEKIAAHLLDSILEFFEVLL